MWKHSILIPIIGVHACVFQKHDTGNNVAYPYQIRHTGVHLFYDTLSVIPAPDQSSAYCRQDAFYFAEETNFIDQGDGTITDNLTGLMWQKRVTPKLTQKEALAYLHQLNKNQYKDWRIPSIKELFSLIDYSGRAFGARSVALFINPAFFEQPRGNPKIGEREIDAQTWTSTECRSLTMGGDASRYGVNFVDGRVKAYPILNPLSGEPNRMYFRFVRGNSDYGLNDYVDNGDGTITDRATGLMWQKNDCRIPLTWKSALEYATGLRLAKYADWRVPNAKELQSLVDYGNNVETSGRPSLSPLFKCTARNDPNGNLNFPYYWSSTTLLDGPRPGSQAVYICFGKASAFFGGRYVDSHGTGAVRSDPKFLSKESYPMPFGPQGDLVYAKNFVRCVRSIH